MDPTTSFYVAEIAGWAAALLTAATLATKAMIPLRLLVLASSILLSVYAVVLQLWPILAINLILIPMNAYRLWQLTALRRVVTHMTYETEPDYSVTMAYGKKREIPAGSVIFEKGDYVDTLYYLAEGSVEIEDQNVTVSAGKIFGEMAFFTGTETRTATVRSVEDSIVYELDKRDFSRLQFEDPQFALAVMSTITKRLVSNAAKTQEH